MSAIENIPQIPLANPSRRRVPERSRRSTGGWLTTFTDTIALMLTFFVMTYSMANPKQEEWDELREQVNMESSTVLGQTLQRGDVNDINLERVEFQAALDLSYLEAVLKNQIKKRSLGESVFLLPDPDQNRLILTIPQRFLFASGRAQIIGADNNIIKQIASILKAIKNSVEIVGHTDPNPITQGNSSFHSNWDLSLQRAMSVAQGLRESGYDQPLHIRGNASALFEALPKTLPNNERMALSRRVDIVIYEKRENFTQRLNVK